MVGISCFNCQLISSFSQKGFFIRIGALKYIDLLYNLVSFSLSVSSFCYSDALIITNSVPFWIWVTVPG